MKEQPYDQAGNVVEEEDDGMRRTIHEAGHDNIYMAQCDLCDKWRYTGRDYDTAPFTCVSNRFWDMEKAHCDVPEENDM